MPDNESVKVKICGITNLEDALGAAEAGADFLGFILWPGSRRAAPPAVTREIAIHLRQLARRPLLVGVFVNETAATMAQLLDDCQLDLAQLSGEEPPALLAEPTSPLYGRAYKALRPTSQAEAEADLEWYLPPATVEGYPTLLIDTYHPALRGGTGRTGDWQMIAWLVAKKRVPGLMLAGGLTPANVAEAVSQVRPFAVDVASGVESGPGHKDHQLLRAFIAACKPESR